MSHVALKIVTVDMWSRMTNMKTLDLSQITQSPSDNFILNNGNVKYMTNLHVLKLCRGKNGFNTPESFKPFIHLQKLDICSISDRYDFEKRFGKDFLVLDYLKELQRVKLLDPDSHSLLASLNYNEFQKKYSHIKFRWLIVLVNGDSPYYEGDFSDNNRWEGRGLLKYNDGAIYRGEVNNGCREGKGVCYYSSGQRYEGEWKNGNRDGKGVFYFPCGERYEGEFKVESMRAMELFI
jgi:hypothetical protein